MFAASAAARVMCCRFNFPSGITILRGSFPLVADTYNHQIRKP
jgi:hypothetical protein